MLWKKLIERKVNTDSLWKGLADRFDKIWTVKYLHIWMSAKIRRGWVQYLFKPRPGECHPSHSFYRRLYPSIIKDIDVSVMLWYQDVKNSLKEMIMKYNDQLCRPSRTTGGVASTTCSESTAEARTAKEFTASSTTTPRSSLACGTTPSRFGSGRPSPA